jgi:hyperosmotically inducible protein
MEKRRKIMKNQIQGLCLVLCLGLSTAAVATLTGCAGNQYDRSTGQYIDDKSINMRVHSALNDNPDYKFADVNVDSFRGTVQLSGFVNNSDQKAKAAEIARGIQGVQKVQNKISVKETQ